MDKMTKNCKIAMLAAAATAASVALAMPTKGEFAKAQPIVNELMNPLVNGYKAKKTSAAEVGAKAVEYAREAETEAAKFLLLKGAITYYSRAEEYDKAADAVDELDRVVKDIPPDTMLDIISRATSRISEANAPRLHAQYRLVSARSQAEKMVAKMKALAAKRPADDVVRRRYAEALAASGNWTAALDEFAKVKGKTGEIAAAEKSGKGVSGDIASFWWDYEPEEQYATDAIKRHAAEFYQKALTDGSLSGLKKTLAEKRIASLGPVVESGAAAAAAAPAAATEKPAVAERKPEPPRAEVSSKPAPAVPASAKGGRWTLPKTFQTPLERSLDLGGGVTMPFCACPAGSFTMRDHKVTITRPFWFSKTVVSLNQLDAFPSGNRWLRNVDANGSMVKFRKQFANRFSTINVAIEVASKYTKELTEKYRGVLPPGYVFRLPTEAEMYYAYYAGADEESAVIPGTDDVLTTTGEALAELGWIPKVNVWSWDSIPRGYGKLVTLPDSNAFGVVPWNARYGYFWILDTVNFDPNKNTYSRGASRDIVQGLDGIKSVMNYAAEEIDPLRTGNHYMEVFVYPTVPIVRFVRGHTAFFMVVIGPDLEAEKKAAKK